GGNGIPTDTSTSASLPALRCTTMRWSGVISAGAAWFAAVPCGAAEGPAHADVVQIKNIAVASHQAIDVGRLAIIQATDESGTCLYKSCRSQRRAVSTMKSWLS